MPANAEIMYDVLTWLETHPERHVQSDWLFRKPSCGTVGCIAGWTCLRNGYVEVADRDWPDVILGVYRDDDVQRRLLDVGMTAMQILGIDESQGARLFEEGNTIPDLWQIADEITDGAVGRMRAEGRVTA